MRMIMKSYFKKQKELKENKKNKLTSRKEKIIRMELKKLLQPVYLNYKDEVGNEVVIQNRMHLLNSNEMEEILDGMVSSITTQESKVSKSDCLVDGALV
jgi:hypothetical protein